MILVSIWLPTSVGNIIKLGGKDKQITILKPPQGGIQATSGWDSKHLLVGFKPPSLIQYKYTMCTHTYVPVA